jgi:hypothetical protein
MSRYRTSQSHPTKDRAAADVLAAYDVAKSDGLQTHDCYRAGVEAWHRAHPDQTLTYAARQAVDVILDAKTTLRIEEA